MPSWFRKKCQWFGFGQNDVAGKLNKKIDLRETNEQNYADWMQLTKPIYLFINVFHTKKTSKLMTNSAPMHKPMNVPFER